MSTLCIKSSLGQLSSLITSGSRGWAQFYSDNGALFLRMTNLPKDGINLLLSDNKYVILPSASNEGKRTSIKQNDILISITAELGKIGFIENNIGEAYVNQHVALIRINHCDVDPKYLAYYLAASPQRNLWQRLNDSGAKSGLNLQTINNFPVSLPSLPDQKTITDMLSTWDSAIEKTERLIKAKEKKFKWLLSQLINKGSKTNGWKKVKLGELFGKEIIVEKGKTLTKNNVQEGSIPVVAGGQVYPYYTNEATHEKPTVTISASGAYAGYVWFHDYPIWASDCNVLYSKKGSTLYLYYVLKLLQYRIFALQSGGAQPHVYSKDLKNLHMPFPSPKQQKQIAETLNIAQKEIELFKKLAEKHKKQKRGLMQKLLTGQWRLTTGKEVK